jgi:hypothetical protein
MAENRTKINILFLAGAVIVTICGLLTAFIEGLAHATHWVNFFPQSSPYYLPISSYIHYYSLNFSVHTATWIYTVCSIGGFLGLAYLFKPKLILAFTSILFTGAGLVLPLYINRMIIPETQYFEVPWIGAYLILAGFSLMLLSLLTQKSRIQKIALPIIAILLASYAVYSVFVVTNSLPYVIYGSTYFQVYPIVGVFTFVCVFALLVLLAFTNKNQLTNWWINEKEINKGKV